MKTHRQESDERHKKRLVRYAEITLMRLNKRQLARFFRVKAPQGTPGLGLRKVMRMSKEEIIWAIVNLDLAAL